MESELAELKCIPCSGGVPPLPEPEVDKLLTDLGQGWAVVNNHHLTKTYEFPDFARALAFVNRVGEMAEQQGHHPDIYLAWGQVRIDVWTHKIDGLTKSDFIFAAKAERLHS